MRLGVVGIGLLVSLACALTACGGTETVTTTVTVDEAAKTAVGQPAEQVEFGYIRSLRRAGSRYVLRFDPAWFLSGETANVAAAEDGVVPPGEPVPNDNYVVNESHRLLTYRVPATARVTVLKDGLTGSRISVVQLAQLVAGGSPFGKPLWEPLTTGFWIRVKVDTVRSLDQQYRP